MLVLDLFRLHDLLAMLPFETDSDIIIASTALTTAFCFLGILDINITFKIVLKVKY